jgi:hypothetical protein
LWKKQKPNSTLTHRADGLLTSTVTTVIDNAFLTDIIDYH